MTKQLYVAYITEGATDEFPLGIIIRRTLERIATEHGGAFDVETVTWLGAAKGNITLRLAQEAYPAGAQLLVIHRDTDQYSAAETMDQHITPIITELGEDFQSSIAVVPLIIKHEQETWLFADLDKLEEILGKPVDRKALNLPPNIEDRSNTKELFKTVLRLANEGQRRGRGLKEDAVATELAEEIRLERLTLLSSYQRFVIDIKAALRKINYLQQQTP